MLGDLYIALQEEGKKEEDMAQKQVKNSGTRG